MSFRARKMSFPIILFLLFGAATGGVASAREPEERAVSFGLSAGYGHSENRGGLLDLMADLRFSLSRNFRDVASQTESSFGPHLGLGMELRAARGILLSAEALYRFVTIKNVQPDLHAGYSVDDHGQHREGFWSYDYVQERFQFHMNGQDMNAIMRDLQPFDIRLSGFALRAGLRFIF